MNPVTDTGCTSVDTDVNANLELVWREDVYIEKA